MTLIEALPKNEDGQIILNPGGIMDGVSIQCTVDTRWFETNYSNIANVEVPLTQEQLNILKIDVFWSENVDKWKMQGII
ncbi:MAG: hypothetical protein LLF98_01975 [Clostridium sp.]|uniref:hypothetical protein n=1 Tax=Clostridium sp. TaxID=1506 RepID=UPI0025BE619A|nr:hypothetical protein [Clostridium sp.]MCE5220049.1 hypothetical protein [Clostridium sp.]